MSSSGIFIFGVTLSGWDRGGAARAYCDRDVLFKLAPPPREESHSIAPVALPPAVKEEHITARLSAAFHFTPRKAHNFSFIFTIFLGRRLKYSTPSSYVNLVFSGGSSRKKLQQIAGRCHQNRSAIDKI